MQTALIAAALVALTGAAAANPAHGVWRTEANAEGEYLEVEIGPCAADPALTCGVIATARDASGAAADYPHLGREMISGMTAEGPAFSGGRIWAPDDDKTYRATMAHDGDRLSVEGCVLLFCRGQDWARVK